MRYISGKLGHPWTGLWGGVGLLQPPQPASTVPGWSGKVSCLALGGTFLGTCKGQFHTTRTL